MDGQQDDTTFQSPQQLHFQPFPETAVYSISSSTVHVPQNDTVKWMINIVQVRYLVQNHCSYTKIKTLCSKKKKNNQQNSLCLEEVESKHNDMKSRPALKMIKEAAGHQH